MAAQKVSRIHERQQSQQKSSQRARAQASKERRRMLSLQGLRDRMSLRNMNLRDRIKLNKGPWPAIGATIAGGVGITAAAALGVGELVLGMAAGYAAYRMYRDGKKTRELPRQQSRPAQEEQEKKEAASS